MSNTYEENGDAADEIIDGDDTDISVPVVTYDVTTYGSDPDVETLVKRLKGDIISIPPFQRDYIWKIDEASRFIESLLLGLPVPSIFLSKENDSQKFLVVDGQQRLKTLQYYIEGIFLPSGKPFALDGVQLAFAGKRFCELSQNDQDKINQSVIHCLNIKQNKPENDNTSIYHIYQRLNSGGRRLSEQEIRVAVYHGSLIKLIIKINEIPEWRTLFGNKNTRKKDQEAILRFIAFRYKREKYEKPLSEYLNKYCGTNKSISDADSNLIYDDFLATVQLIKSKIGDKAFKPISNFNVAVFESLAVAVSENFDSLKTTNASDFVSRYKHMLGDEEYKDAVSKATSDEASIEARFRIAKRYF